MGIIIDDDGVMHKVFTKDEVVDMLTEIQIKANNICPNIYTCASFTEGIMAYNKLIQQKIDKLGGEKHE